jgi:hypothetical protein
MKINEQWTGKNMEVSSLGLIWGTVPSFVYKDWGKPQRTLAITATVLPKTWTGHKPKVLLRWIPGAHGSYAVWWTSDYMTTGSLPFQPTCSLQYHSGWEYDYVQWIGKVSEMGGNTLEILSHFMKELRRIRIKTTDNLDSMTITIHSFPS